jgi:hypothetical protein
MRQTREDQMSDGVVSSEENSAAMLAQKGLPKFEIQMADRRVSHKADMHMISI